MDSKLVNCARGVMQNTDPERWNKMYAELLAFQEVHGNLSVPRERTGKPLGECNKCPGVSHKLLGTWVVHQRTAFSQKELWLTDERKKKLEALKGWQWKTGYRPKWADRLADLVKFLEDHKGEGIKLQRDPKACKRGECNGESHHSLGIWAHTQRQQQKRGKMSPDRQKKLDAVPGWWWTA